MEYTNHITEYPCYICTDPRSCFLFQKGLNYGEDMLEHRGLLYDVHTLKTQWKRLLQ